MCPCFGQEKIFLTLIPKCQPLKVIFLFAEFSPLVWFSNNFPCSIMSDNVLWSLHLSATTSTLLFLYISSLLLCLKGIQETLVPLQSVLLLKGLCFSGAHPLITIRSKGDMSCASPSSPTVRLCFPFISWYSVNAFLSSYSYHLLKYEPI